MANHHGGIHVEVGGGEADRLPQWGMMAHEDEVNAVEGEDGSGGDHVLAQNALGFWDGVALCCGDIIGSGIFASPVGLSWPLLSVIWGLTFPENRATA